MGIGWDKKFQLQTAILTIHKKLQHITNCKMKMWKEGRKKKQLKFCEEKLLIHRSI